MFIYQNINILFKFFLIFENIIKMVSSNNTDSSSEDEEVKKRFQEAVEAFEFDNTQNKTNIKSKHNNNRNHFASENQHHDDLNLTQEFRDFVAKKLQLAIDSTVEFIQINHVKKSQNIQNNQLNFQVFTNIFMNDDKIDFFSTKNKNSSKLR
jgi:hypothetical protein